MPWVVGGKTAAARKAALENQSENFAARKW
jgi:hypothetical protein